MVHNCEYCNYNTTSTSNWQKHLNTKKHKDSEKIEKEITKFKNKVQKENKALKNYKQHYDDYILQIEILKERHDKDSYEIQTLRRDNEILKQENKNLQEQIQLSKNKEIELLQKQIEIISQNKNNEIQLLKEQSIVNNDCIKSSNKIINKTLDVISHITSTYTDAPPLQPLNDYSLIFPNIQNTMKEVAYHKNKNMIDKYVGGIIMKEYIKDDPSSQSSWTTDYSRSTFTIKQTTWIMDKGGIHMKDKIIRPILSYIRNMASAYIEKEGTTDDLEKMRELIDIREVMAKIDRDELADPINRYIAPYFCPEQNKLLMTDVKK